MDALPAMIGGRYRPLRLVGKGGMGAVYEVEHVHTGQHLALKVISGAAMSDEAVDRFKREARASGRIKSDHVVRVTDADVAPELDGAPFLVMELLEGSDLEAATEGGPASPAEVVVWLEQVARALGRAHDMGIVHRDLKPENLFLTTRDDGSPCVKVLDFGIAKIVADGQQKTASGQVLGTPLYMAPEQADPAAAAPTTRTDLFALGLIAYRLLVGRTYWKDGTLAQLVTQILVEPMAPASSRGSTLGPRFDEWFAKACARDPEKRFATAQEQIAALAVALDVELARPSASVSGSRPAQQSGSQPRLSTLEGASTLAVSWNTQVAQKRNRVVAGAVVVAALLAGGLVWTRVRSPHDEPRHLAASSDTASATASTSIADPPRASASATATVIDTVSSAAPAIATTSTKIVKHTVPSARASSSAAAPTKSADPLGDPY